MAVAFEGVLADRSTWILEKCSIAMTMDYGTTRFDDFVKRTRTTDAIVSARLKQLTELGLLSKQPYQEPAQRTRYEYLLTDKGRELLPTLFAMMQWGNKHLQPDEGPLRLVARGTGEPVRIVALSASGKELNLEDLAIEANGDWAPNRP
jgi:DNA-binding HxlR family transcriptional regulator